MVKFKDIRCGDWFLSDGMALIRCEPVSGTQKWNAVDLVSGISMKIKNNAIVEVIDFKKFHMQIK